MHAQADKIADFVNRIPELDKYGKLTAPPWAEAEKIFDAILEGGRESILELVGLIREVDDGQDYKARYVLHGLSVYLCRSGKEKVRATFTEALASQLGGNRPKSVQGFLVRQLQVVGRKEVAEAVGRLLLDPDLCDYAAQALLAIREGAVEQFRKALSGATGRLRLTVLHALGVLRDAASMEALKKAVGDENLDTRLTALWGLANIGDPSAVEPVLKAADVEARYERIKATHACLLLAERLLAAGRKEEAKRIYRHLRDSRSDDSERYVREAAEKALAAAGG